MFTCISQLWGWLEADTFESATMNGRQHFNVPQDIKQNPQFSSDHSQNYYLTGAYQQQQSCNLLYDSDYIPDPSSSDLPLNEFGLTDDTHSYGRTPDNLYYDHILQNQTHAPQENERFYQAKNRISQQSTATSRLKQQYQLLQEEKMRMQIQTQNDAFLQQQQTFALRQQLNPPVPLLYPQSPCGMSTLMSQQHPFNVSLTNTNNQYLSSPEGKSDIDYQSTTHYKTTKDHNPYTLKGQSKHLQSLNLQSPQNYQIIIQQNHPSKVVNQAVQTQMSDTSQKSSSSTSITPQSPSHNILERRKSESLKSPIIKRIDGAPITLSGYLHKQGSDGLKVWKKRYFVLSQYCLFYYKNAEQDKLLGSVLLPSYSISPCNSDDKINKKYAFKCEHANMRTYILAAETQESMDNWIKHLTMAAAMQDNSEHNNILLDKTTNDAVPRIYQSYGYSVPNETQPLYINAPPKPSRKVGSDIVHNSPTSPDNSMVEIYDSPKNSLNFVNTQAIYGSRNDTVTTNILKTNAPSIQQIYQSPHKTLSQQQHSSYTVPERRTPDQYSTQDYLCNKLNYEDLYGQNNITKQTESYRRPLSPQNTVNQLSQLYSANVLLREKSSTSTVPRPHSADILDYENRLPYEDRRTTRPKSSLDINKALDQYYYSEASYAEQMRTESANYLPKQSHQGHSHYTHSTQVQNHENRARKINKRALRQQEFLRSASARVPRKIDFPIKPEENDKKREESMKRLLEWKQRMLQSPLTRKIASQTNTLPMETRQSAVEGLMKTTIHRAKSEIIKKEDPYNSYSSDDEGNLIVKSNITPSFEKTAMSKNELGLNTDKQKIKAGELLNRTHEELVLLLIQLRKENTLVVRHIEKCCTKIHEIQNKIRVTDGPEKQMNYSKLHHLKSQLSDLERKYEESKPLVNLVDNMVKLGSLYNKNSDGQVISSNIIEQNQREQERRMFADEKQQWDRISPNPVELQNKVKQLDDLDQLLHEESSTLQTLQKNKEGIERAISGLQCQLQNNNTSNGALEAAKKQQQVLEEELSHVHKLLAENSKKLETTVNSNRKLEQELLVLRQKLQSSKETKISKVNIEGGSSTYGSSATAILESELRRVQVLVADMQRQRQDLSFAVRQLTDNSNSLYDQLKKRSDAWSETDLDENINARNKSFNYSDQNERSLTSDLDIQSFSNLSLQDKQEIKTVRIVKREAEKRQRDREKTDKSIQILDDVLKEELNVLQEYNQTRNRSQSGDLSSKGIPLVSSTNPFKSSFDQSVNLADKEDYSYLVDFSENNNQGVTVKSQKNNVDLGPIYQSEAAKQIITEMSHNMDNNAETQRRLIPREKKRHNTVPHHVNAEFLELMLSTSEPKKNAKNSRALDDIDIEVALRPRVNAPDVVKSAISQREKISENTIDKLFSTPDKIFIPERYIPENEELELTPDEQLRRKAKVESIKKMLSETPSCSDSQTQQYSQLMEEKKQREHLLQLNQIIAKQVMQMSKIVAERAMTFCPSNIVELQNEILSEDEDSPVPLPIYQMRDNFFS
ncbi:myosin-13 isoform X2 [Culicoides brevitarsis]|uniref:myosin-13 isoform X2 n=1 Tax=Culicoides brevitarsis TaxID=469753 RepID=UPI00307B7AFD